MISAAQVDPRYLTGMPGGEPPSPAAAAPAALPPPVTTQTTPMFDPGGTVRQIPADQAAAAATAGGKPAFKMLDPSGTARWIPQESLAAAAAAGGTPANMQESRRIQAVLPKAQGTGPIEDAIQTLHTRGVLGDQDVNAIREVARTGSGLDQIGHKIVTAVTGAPTHMNDLEQSFREVAQGKNAGSGVNLGGMAETMGEWMAGEGEAKAGMTALQKMNLAMPLMKIAEKYPRVARALAGAARQGLVGGTQAYVKTGGDSGEAAGIGAAIGAAGGLTEGIGAKAGEAIEATRPSTETIGGEDVPVLASQRAGGSKFGGATSANTPEIAEAQQQKAQAVIRNNAQDAYKRSIDRVNAARQAVVPETNPARLLQAPVEEPQFSHTIQTDDSTPGINDRGAFNAEGNEPTAMEGPEPQPPGDKMAFDPRKRQIGTTVEPGNPTANTNSKGVRKVPTFQYFTGFKPGGEPLDDLVGTSGKVTLTDPALATKHLSNLDELMRSPEFDALPPEQQAQIAEQHRSLGEALDMHHAARPAGPAGPTSNPRFNPIDPADAIPHIEHYGDVDDQLEAAVKPVYHTLDDISGNRFSELRRQQKQALSIIKSAAPTSMEAIAKAHLSADEAEAGIDKIFELGKQSGRISPEDYKAAQSAYSDSKLYGRVHATLEGAFNGVSKATEAKTAGSAIPVTRQITKLTTERLGQIEKRFTPEQMTRVFGPNGFTSIQQMATLLKKPETAQATKGVLYEMTKHLTRHITKGALIGGAIGHSTGFGLAEGAATGALAEGAMRVAFHRIVTTPAAGKLLDYAVRNGVTPKLAGGLIAASVNAGMNTGHQEKKDDQQ